jgi:hypothetical protein
MPWRACTAFPGNSVLTLRAAPPLLPDAGGRFCLANFRAVLQSRNPPRLSVKQMWERGLKADSSPGLAPGLEGTRSSVFAVREWIRSQGQEQSQRQRAGVCAPHDVPGFARRTAVGSYPYMSYGYAARSGLGAMGVSAFGSAIGAGWAERSSKRRRRRERRSLRMRRLLFMCSSSFSML